MITNVQIGLIRSDQKEKVNEEDNIKRKTGVLKKMVTWWLSIYLNCFTRSEMNSRTTETVPYF